MKKKIIISTFDSLGNPDYWGGGAVSIHEIAKRLVKKYDVVVLTWNFRGAENGKIHGVEYLRIGANIFGPKVNQIFYHLILPFYVMKLNFDIWIESFTPPFSTSFTPVFTNKPVVGLGHMLAGIDMRRKYKIPFDWLESIGLRFYKRFIVINENDKRKILKVNSKAKVVVIHNGVALPKLKSRVKKHILFLGRIEINQKGLDLLIGSYARCLNEIKLPLVIAGSGDVKEIGVLKDLIRENNVGNKILLKGRVEGKKKNKLFEEAVCVVVPSRYETFSVVALEAMSYGIPLVTFDIPGLSWIPRGCRLSVKKFDEESFGKQIAKLSKESKMKSRMREVSLKKAKDFTWGKVYKRYSEFLKREFAY